MPEPKIIATPAHADGASELRKGELIDAVVTHSGLKKNVVKPVVESLLAVLGQELAKGREFNLQPMGKMKVNRVREVPNGKVITAKLRQSDQSGQGNDNNPDKDPLADAAE